MILLRPNRSGATARSERVVVNDGSLNTVFKGSRKVCEEVHLGNALQRPDSTDQQGISTSISHLYSLLQDSINKKDLQLGREVHCLIRRSGFDSNSFLGSHLIRMFASFGSLLEAHQVFRRLSNPSVFSWGAIISAHDKLGRSDQAIKLYHKMQSSGLEPDAHLFVTALKACLNAAALTEGKLIHAHVIQCGFESNVFVRNVLIDMYAKCDSIEEAQTVFDNSAERTVVTWTTMAVGYVQHGHPKKALQLFQRMQEKGLEMDHAILVSLLKACSSLTCLSQAKLIHIQIIESGIESDALIGSILIDTYAKCGSLHDACKSFNTIPNRDVVTWNAMIAGHAQPCTDQEAFKLFLQMQMESVEPDQVTFVSILKACSSMAALGQGELFHKNIIDRGFESSAIVASCLIDMYTKCGSMEDACRVFDLCSDRDIVIWSVMIVGLTNAGHNEKALQIFQKLRQEIARPNSVTFSCILNACSSIGALDQGKLIHADIIENGCESDVYVASALVDMFAKCGCFKDADKLFKKLPKQDVVIWNSMIAGYAQNGNVTFALQHLKHMQREGLKANGATFVSLLSACSHQGFVGEGCSYFNLLRQDHGIEPTLDHYNCIIDLLGRAGHLKEAEDLLQIMPFQANVVGWTTLLSHCKTHQSLEQGYRCFHQVVAIDIGYAAAYVLMSSIYYHAGMWKDANRLDELRRSSSAWKKPGAALLEVSNNVCNFVVGDTCHPQADDIYAKFNRLGGQMVDEGYAPQLDMILPSTSHLL